MAAIAEKTIGIILPFSNEIANVLTSSGMIIFKGLYMDHPITTTQKLSKVLIDFVALAGIIFNAVSAAELHGKFAGLIKGVGVLLIAFIIPNLTIHDLLDKFCFLCSPIQKIGLGLLFIGMLSGFEFLFDRFIVESRFIAEKEEKRHMK